MSELRILLVEPWPHGSHLQWAEGYQAASRHRVDVIGHPGTHWRWTLRAGALELATAVEAWVGEHGVPDVLLISGLVDVAQLLGLARRLLQPMPSVVVYQHESQLLYPGRRAADTEVALRNWMSWCAADLVLFNSRFHRDAVADALPEFLGRIPDPTHLGRLGSVLETFEVAPVGVDLASLPNPSSNNARSRAEHLAELGLVVVEGPVILWPHRWEPDKDPEAFSAALSKLASADQPFGVILAGEDPPGGSTHVATVRSELAQRFEAHVMAVGPFERAQYRSMLSVADIVVSCAHHEFFGVGVTEAVAAGARPVVPNALAYPELIASRWHEVALYPPGRFGSALSDAVRIVGEDRLAARADIAGLAESMGRFDWATVAPCYDDLLEALT